MFQLDLSTIGAAGNLSAMIDQVRSELPAGDELEIQRIAAELLGRYHIAHALNRLASAIEMRSGDNG
ncbi:MAG: hypothetical protein AB1832_00980 [Pseudomonadota bacterium]